MPGRRRCPNVRSVCLCIPFTSSPRSRGGHRQSISPWAVISSVSPRRTRRHNKERHTSDPWCCCCRGHHLSRSGFGSGRRLLTPRSHCRSESVHDPSATPQLGGWEVGPLWTMLPYLALSVSGLVDTQKPGTLISAALVAASGHDGGPTVSVHYLTSFLLPRSGSDRRFDKEVDRKMARNDTPGGADEWRHGDLSIFIMCQTSLLFQLLLFLCCCFL